MALYRGMELVVKPNDTEHRGYYEHAKAGRLVVQKCGHCGKLRSIMGAGCPFCTSLKWSWEPVSGRGSIYSWQIVTHSVQPAFRDWVPYPVVLVQLEEQPNLPWRDGRDGEAVSLRMIANLCRKEDPTRPESEARVAIGKPVKVCFLNLGEDIALPQFCLDED